MDWHPVQWGGERPLKLLHPTELAGKVPELLRNAPVKVSQISVCSFFSCVLPRGQEIQEIRNVNGISKIQLVVCYQCCVLIG